MKNHEYSNSLVSRIWAQIIFGVSLLAGFSNQSQHAAADGISQKDTINMATEKNTEKYVQKIATYPPILPMAEISDTLRRELDVEFDGAIKELVEQRVATKANDIDATPFFQKIIAQHSVEILHDYLNKRYRLERYADSKGNLDSKSWNYIGDSAKSLDNRFYRTDKLFLDFRFSPDWVRIDSFSAWLLWDQDWP